MCSPNACVIKCTSPNRETAFTQSLRDLSGEERGDVVHAVAVVVGGDQLEHGELPALRGGQVNGQTQACGGGEGHTQPVALTGGPPPAFTCWHVLQHVSLQ